MASELAVDLEIKEYKAVKWTLNNVLSRVNRLLPNSALLFLYGRLIGWVPVFRWRAKGRREGWQTVTILDLVQRQAARADRQQEGDG